MPTINVNTVQVFSQHNFVRLLVPSPTILLSDSNYEIRHLVMYYDMMGFDAELSQVFLVLCALAISCSCQSLGWEEYFFLLTNQLLQSHCLNVTIQGISVRVKQGSPARTTQGAISCKIQTKAKLEFFLPKWSLSFRAKKRAAMKG